MEQEFDVVLWGATGFTGKLVAEFLYQKYGAGERLRWAIGGRNEARLIAVRQQFAGDDADKIPIVIADSNNGAALDELVARTRVVCTTVGPYALYGSEMVRACAQAGTHYCDLTGEVPWMYRMITEHQATAEASGARIVHTCGFDSIPFDMGVYFLQREMKAKHGEFASTVSCRVVNFSGGVSGGTVESMMHMMEQVRADPTIMETLSDPYALNPQNMPRGDDTNDQTGAVYDTDFHQWTAPFVMAGVNTRVVRRSHALQGYCYGKEFRYSESTLAGDGPMGYTRASMIAGGSILMVLAGAFGPTRSLLRKIAPAPGEGPSSETIRNGSFNIEFLGKCANDPRQQIKVSVTGDRDPGYGATSKMLAETAVCLAKDELSSAGGVLTPASAMGDFLISRLCDNAGMTFSVVDSQSSQEK